MSTTPRIAISTNGTQPARKWPKRHLNASRAGNHPFISRGTRHDSVRESEREECTPMADREMTPEQAEFIEEQIQRAEASLRTAAEAVEELCDHDFARMRETWASCRRHIGDALMALASRQEWRDGTDLLGRLFG